MPTKLRPFYQQQQVEVRYLDDDPDLAARYHPDQQLSAGLLQAVRIMSNVWVMSNEKNVTCDWHPRYFFGDQLLPGTTSGSMSAFIGRSRIYPMLPCGLQRHLHVTWAAQYGGNYGWLWRLSAALCREYPVRGLKKSPLAKIVDHLKETPPHLRSSAKKWCEPYFVGAEELDDDSTVIAYRRLMAAQVDRLTWTPELPEWLEPTYCELVA